MRRVLNSTDSELKELFSGTPLIRAKPKGLRRNAIIVSTNEGLLELKEDIRSHIDSEDLSDLVTWSLERL